MLFETEQTSTSIGSIQNCIDNFWRYKYFIYPERFESHPTVSTVTVPTVPNSCSVDAAHPTSSVVLILLISSWIMECKWWNWRSSFQTKFKRLSRTITRINFIVGTREKEYWNRKRYMFLVHIMRILTVTSKLEDRWSTRKRTQTKTKNACPSKKTVQCPWSIWRRINRPINLD